jgi:hypothetical protein
MPRSGQSVHSSKAQILSLFSSRYPRACSSFCRGIRDAVKKFLQFSDYGKRASQVSRTTPCSACSEYGAL